jgi:hypothetical protein
MIQTLYCDMCKRELFKSTIIDIVISAKILMSVTDYCDKCKQSHERNKEFHFCSPDCLVEFASKRLINHAINLRKGK